MSELDLPDRYGKNTWVLITGPSSGMGKQFALQFAKRGFNLYLIGSKRTNKIIQYINKKYPNVRVKFTEVDFSNSFDNDFFLPIENTIKDIDLSIVINNVGNRVAAKVYEDMPIQDMKNTISTGTLVQSVLIQYAINAFKKRPKGAKSCIVNITAQCTTNTDLFNVHEHISVPHLACYEASNGYGFFHAKSVHAEIMHKYPDIDFLIIRPGAVITEKTKKVLSNTIFAIDVETYVENIIRLIGNKNGICCAHYGHSFTPLLLNLFPFIDLEKILSKVGHDFAVTKV